MNADAARQVLLARAFESPIAAPWTETDAAWAGAEAVRIEGEAADLERLVVRRAALAARRLAERDPAIATALAAAARPAAWVWLLLPAAFVIGLAIDAIGPTGRLNIVALPLLGVLAWNLAVYALLAWHAVRGATGPGGGRTSAALLQRWMHGDARRLVGRGALAPALLRFVADWAHVGRALHVQRTACVMHAAAAALAAGMLASLYLRGLAFEYRAGWDSTFLGPDGVHGLLSVVLGPALAITGGTLPSADALATLRFSAGPGENAARWIHLLALTIGLLVLLPRGLLAALAAWRARHLEQELPLDLDTPYFRRLTPARQAAGIAVHVLPYSYSVGEALRPGLQAVLERTLGARVTLTVADPVPMGGEDALDARWLPAAADDALLLLPLLAMTATPERETHGAFLAALAGQHRGSEGRNLVLIDESGFLGRFDASRRAQRRSAWQSLLAELGLTPLFADLMAPPEAGA